MYADTLETLNIMLLSIIVPVYNVEQYIRPCVESIYKQGLNEQDFEVILVDDGATDNSLGKIADIVESHSNINIIRQSNQGLSVARNTGLRHAVGQFVLFLDSDDLFIPDTVGQLLKEGLEHQADLVVAGFVKMNNDDISHQKFDPAIRADAVVKTGTDVFLYALNPRECYVWRTLYRKEFLEGNQLRFIPGIYFEDVPFTVECYLKAGRCIVTSQPFYIYRQRENSIVSTVNMQKLKDMNEVVARLWHMRLTMELPEDQHRKLMEIIFSTFSIAVWYITHDKKLLARRREFVGDLRQRVPQLQFTNNAKQRIVSFFFRLMPCTYIKLRSFSNLLK